MSYQFSFRNADLIALPTGALWWPKRRILCVSDLHLGKSERIARRGGTMLPPYEIDDTLGRLSDLIEALQPLTVICLGDSFDDLAAEDALAEQDHALLTHLMAGRRWVWIEGNHDPGPLSLGGSHLKEHVTDEIVFRHIASDAVGEISGHYHPKASLSVKSRTLTRPCFLIDDKRIILPAFGTYTGGLKTDCAALTGIMMADAKAVLTGQTATAIPMPR